MSEHSDIVGMILAAGEGTRMRPLTRYRPKPLLPFGGVPILERIAANLQPLGLRATGVNAHHLADQLLPWLREHHPTFVQNHETQLLGSGGGVRAMHALLPPSEHFLYHNGDIFTDASLPELIELHRRSGADVTMLLTPSATADGNVGFDRDSGRVVALPSHDTIETTQNTFVRTSFGGIMVFKRSIIQLLPADNPAPCIIRDAITPLLLAGGTIQGLYHTGIFSDLGTHERWIAGLRSIAPAPFPDERVPELPEPIILRAGKFSVRFTP